MRATEPNPARARSAGVREGARRRPPADEPATGGRPRGGSSAFHGDSRPAPAGRDGETGPGAHRDREPRPVGGGAHRTGAAALVVISLVALAAACTRPGRPGAADLTVRLADGAVQGDLVGGTRRFLKIPYAAPPTGERRWRAPMPNAPWPGTRHETGFGSPCPQTANVQTAASTDEDCLYANVWTPEPAPRQAPVMVWIHGGGNVSGSAGDNVPLTNQPWYDGRYFAGRHGVVLVSFNYRLGAMGFLAHPALAAEGSPLGNQGLLDQRRLFEWVRDNVAAFGGDPGNVTIFGESAGSADVCYHVASPGSRGLFHRAISESGGCTAAGGLDRTAAQAAPTAEAFARTAGCDAGPGPEVLVCLRARPAADILAAASRPLPGAGTAPGGPPLGFTAVTEDGPGGVLPVRPRTAFERGDVARVPYIIGSNEDEGTLFDLGTSVTTGAQYAQALQTRFPGFADEVEAMYPSSRFGGSYKAALDAVVGDVMMVCGTRESARYAQRAGLPVYAYTFDVPWNLIPGITPALLGASHASEISHVFGSPLNADARSRAVSDAMNAYWAAFAATGDPNHAGAPVTWPRFAPGDGGPYQVIRFAPPITVVPDHKRAECEFWARHSS